MPQIRPLGSVLRVILAVAAAFPGCRSTGNEPGVSRNDPLATTAATPLAIVGGPERPVIEGTGRYVMPALIDVHVHLNSSQDLQAYVFPGERDTPRGIDDAQ